MKKNLRVNLYSVLTAGISVSLIISFAASAWKPLLNMDWQYRAETYIFEMAEEMYMPVFKMNTDRKTGGAAQWLRTQALSWIPLISYVEEHSLTENSLEDDLTVAKILEAQANDENMVDENGKLVGDTDVSAEPAENAESGSTGPKETVSMEKLRDYEYLLGNFYTVDSSTMIGPDQLNADELLGRNMQIDINSGGPKILVYHTHSQEGFSDSDPANPDTGIVGIGTYLTELLNQKGISTIHDTGVYDVINGKLDRSNAYEYAKDAVSGILKDNPEIEVLIDLHRDGVAEGTHLVTDINGKQTAKIMFFNGLSRSRTNGDIDYLPNPYIQDNLAFSFQMQLKAETEYPGFVRHIYLKAYRYNMHLMPRSLLVEAGAQTNSIQEMRNAMEILADILYEVLTQPPG